MSARVCSNLEIPDAMIKAALQASLPGGHKVWHRIPVADPLDRHEIMECALSAAFAVADEWLRKALVGPIWTAEAVRELVETLEWYAEQSRLCRLIHSEGDTGRHALSEDGGKRARKALDAFESPAKAPVTK